MRKNACVIVSGAIREARTATKLASIGLLAVLGAFEARAPAEAAESGVGVYVLGLRGPGAGITPPEGLFFSSQTYFYDGDIAGRIPLEGDFIAANARVSPIVEIPTLLWSTPVQIGSARLGASLTVPFGYNEVSGVVGLFRLEDDIFTVGDPSVGLFLGDRAGDFHWQLGVTGFLPIGDYQEGELANIAKHRAALDVYGALTWIEPTSGIDVSNVLGVTFNAKNQSTNYRTGNEFHWEWAVSKKFESGVSLGAIGYYYKQLTDDSGEGALLGGFRGEVTAIGVMAGYDFLVGRAPVSAKVKYYHELESKNRLKGDAVFLTLSAPLWVKQ